MPSDPYYRISVIHNGRRYRIMDTLSLDEAVARVVGGDSRWPCGLVRGAVVTDDLGNLIDPRKYGGRAQNGGRGARA